MEILQVAAARLTAYPKLAVAARQQDAILASFPKSGRTWFRYLLACYFALRTQAPLPGLGEKFRYLPNLDFDPVRGLPAATAAASGLPAVAVTHRSYSRLLFGRLPVLFLVRDPRDVMVSAYHHETRHKNRFSGSVSEFLVSPLGLPRMIDYLNGWGEGLPRHPHLLLSYEQLSADQAGTAERALAFLGLKADPNLLDQAVAAAGFDRMQSLERKEGLPAHTYDRDDLQSLRMRKGKVGGFAETLTEADLAVIAEGCATGLSQGAKRLFA